MPNTTYTTSEAVAKRAIATRKVQASLYGLSGRWATVVVLPASRKGANARGTAASKRGYGFSPPKGAKRARKQNTHIRGAQPRIAATNWNRV